MPKTRRAGRKNQLRRLVAQLYYTASANTSGFEHSDHFDKEYEELFSGKVTNVECRIEWPAQLTLVDLENKVYRPDTLHEKDPRGATPRTPA